MFRKNQNNRSLLARAGQSALNSSYNNLQSLKDPKSKPPVEPLNLTKPYQSIEATNISGYNTKDIMKKLGFARLRKMQALVRGFIVRRTVYPKELRDYLIAQSVLDIITSNVIYRQCSGLIVETVTLGRYDQDQSGEERLIQEYLYNAIIRRVVEKQFEPIAKDAIYETAVYASRPTITFGFNMRDPMELLLYTKTTSIMTDFFTEIAEESLKEQVQNRRQLQVIDSLIEQMGTVGSLCQQVIDQCLLEGVEEYVSQNLINKMAKQGAQMVAELIYTTEIGAIEDKFIDELSGQAEEWLLQQMVLKTLMEGDVPEGFNI